MSTTIRRPSLARRRAIILAAAVVAAIVVALGILATFYTDILWFRETGYGRVFWSAIWTKVSLGAVFGAAFTALVLLNLWVARRITNPTRLFSVPDQILERYRATLQPYARWGIIGGSILFGLFAGSGAATKWRDWLLFKHPSTFGSIDPVFKKDISFYVFKLPFEQFVFTWLFSTLVVVTIIAGIAHYFMGGIRPQARGDRVSPEVRAHLSVLLGSIVLLKAWGYRLSEFNLLYSGRGVVGGASYTDVHSQLPALKLLVIIAIISAVFFFVNARYKNWVLPLGAIGLLALVSIVGGGIYPAAVQRFDVAPNERLRERPYIERNIAATREAFQIDGVTVRRFSAAQDLTLKDIDTHADTINNIRLWDPNDLQKAMVNLQRIKQYYEFFSPDLDRYTINGKRTQVMVAPREIYLPGLDPSARTWLNTHLVYTHGYGVVVSPVNAATPEGQPDFVVRDIPPVSDPGAPKIAQPQIYYGQSEQTSFVVVRSKQQELDFPNEGTEGFQPATYDGKGGIQLGGILRRAAFAWRFRDFNLMISGAVGAESRLMMIRNVYDRVSKVAPFVKVDGDPYLAVVDGRPVWILDAYTTSSMYPYAQRVDLAAATDGSIGGVANYIRNSVKFVVDAKDGTVTAYGWDESDPVLQSWMKAFPGIITPRSKMSADLLAHVRYPSGMFKVQTDRYSNYHITDPDNFYSKEDAWTVPADPTGGAASFQTPLIPPYYMLMGLPLEDSNKLDYVLVRPFTPSGRDNLIGYMAANGDPGKYGELTAYALPKSSNIFGPSQVQTKINSDPVVSPYISLNNQSGSTVIRGNLLVIPIKNSFLYVQPLYVQGSGAQLPLLKRVVVVAGDKVRMGATLEEALRLTFGEGQASSEDTVRNLLALAVRHFNNAQDALKNGDFARYGKEIQLAQRALEDAAAREGIAANGNTGQTGS